MSLQFLVIAGPDKGKLFAVHPGPDMMLGRGHHAYYQINDPEAARNHCQILLEGDKVTVVCNAGGGSTQVNGKKIQRHTLKPGDVLQAGHTQLRLYSGEVPPQDEEGPATVPVKAEHAGHSGHGHSPPRVEPLTDLAGTTVGHYALDRVIGTGHTCVVFHANDSKNDDRSVAFKVFQKEYVHDDEEMQHFVRAVKTALPLRHPNLVTLYAAGKNSPYCWMALEYVEGENLQQVIDRGGTAGPLDWRQAFRAALQVGRALEYGHAQHIVHGNVTPTNILRDAAGKVVKLNDLILARAVAGSATEDVTSSGAKVGDLAFLSPERIRGATDLDARSDLYGLGAVVYGVLTGRPPFTGATVLEKITRIRQSAPDKPSKYQAGIPAKFEAIVLKLLAKRPEERHQTAGELVGELERLGRASGLAE
jgi:serine/threonine protein kinase